MCGPEALCFMLLTWLIKSQIVNDATHIQKTEKKKLEMPIGEKWCLRCDQSATYSGYWYCFLWYHPHAACVHYQNLPVLHNVEFPQNSAKQVQIILLISLLQKNFFFPLRILNGFPKATQLIHEPLCRSLFLTSSY